MRGYDDFKQRRQEGLWHSLNRLVVTLIVFGVVIAVVCLYLPELEAVRHQAEQVEALKVKIETEKVLLARRTREVELLKNDREYIETVARDRLEVMKEGETIYRLDSRMAATPGGR